MLWGIRKYFNLSNIKLAPKLTEVIGKSPIEFTVVLIRILVARKLKSTVAV